MKSNLKDVKVGDTLVRCIGSGTPLHVLVEVVRIKGSVVWVSIPKEQLQEVRRDAMKKLNILEAAFKYEKQFSKEELENSPEWTFSINTGGEIDTFLGWDGIYTGSYLIKPEDNDSRPTNS